MLMITAGFVLPLFQWCQLFQDDAILVDNERLGAIKRICWIFKRAFAGSLNGGLLDLKMGQ